MQVGDVEQVPVSKRAALAEVEVGGCGGVEPKCIGPVGDGAVGELLPELSGQGSAGRCRWGVAAGRVRGRTVVSLANGLGTTDLAMSRLKDHPDFT